MKSDTSRNVSLFAFYEYLYYMANKTQYTKEELKNIINAEIKSFVKNEMENEVKKLLSKPSGNVRKEVANVVKDGLAKFAEFMFVRKGVWQTDIK